MAAGRWPGIPPGARHAFLPPRIPCSRVRRPCAGFLAAGGGATRMLMMAGPGARNGNSLVHADSPAPNSSATTSSTAPCRRVSLMATSPISSGGWRRFRPPFIAIHRAVQDKVDAAIRGAAVRGYCGRECRPAGRHHQARLPRPHRPWRQSVRHGSSNWICGEPDQSGEPRMKNERGPFAALFLFSDDKNHIVKLVAGIERSRGDKIE